MEPQLSAKKIVNYRQRSNQLYQRANPIIYIIFQSSLSPSLLFYQNIILAYLIKLHYIGKNNIPTILIQLIIMNHYESYHFHIGPLLTLTALNIRGIITILSFINLSLIKMRNDKLYQSLDMKNISDMLLATREDLEKCKTKDHDISDHAINKIYAQTAVNMGIEPVNAYELYMKEMDGTVHFNTGNEELDKQLGDQKVTSNEIVEISGCSGSGKTFLCIKMACLALIERDVAVLYVDTTNYLNRDNVLLSLKNFMTAGEGQASDKAAKAEKAREMLGRLQVVQIHDMDRLILLLAKLLSRLEHKQLNFPLKMIVIDSLSSLFWETSSQSMGKSHHDKQQQQLIKEVLYYLSILAKKYNICIVFTNNTRDGAQAVTRVSEISCQLGEPLGWAVDKQIYACQDEQHQVSYVLIKH